MPWTLLLNRYVLGALAIAALVAFLAYQKGAYDDRRREEGAAPYITAIVKQKEEAAAQLSEKINENARREEADRQRAITNQKDYDAILSDYQKRLADADAKRRADGLRFNVERRGVCGDSAGSQASASAGATQDVPLEIRIPDATANALFTLAIEADELRVWAKSCHAFVNQSTP